MRDARPFIDKKILLIADDMTAEDIVTHVSAAMAKEQQLEKGMIGAKEAELLEKEMA
jgi:hypothetical protein